MHLGSFFFEPEDIMSISLGAVWNYSKVTRLLWFDMGHKGPVIKAYAHRDCEVLNPRAINQNTHPSIHPSKAILWHMTGAERKAMKTLGIPGH